MAVKVLMPALSPTTEKGNVLRWRKQVGDDVKPGDLLVEIETDKVTMDVEAVDSGILTRILVESGTDDVPVNAVIALLTDEEAATAAPLSGTSDDARGSARRSPELPASAASMPPSASRILISPLARRLAGQHGIEAAELKGTGSYGRIVKRDIENELKTVKAADIRFEKGIDKFDPSPDHARKRTATAVSASPVDEIRHSAPRVAGVLTPSNSKSTVPHFYLQVDCRMDRLLSLCRDLNEASFSDATGRKLSISDLAIKAYGLSLISVDEANVSWTEQHRLKHSHADIAVAIATTGGIVAPVVRRVEKKSLSALSLEISDLVTRSNQRMLSPEDYVGGTATVFDLATYGIKSFSSVLEPPQATALAIGAINRCPIIDDDKMAIGNVMSVTLSVDHRALDGAVAAALLDAFRTFVENPLRLCA
jgi:pyruvate dehydrogenase E2 component (dihydrolipoamide acetyltransferase)